jgi:hypothetical protein
MKFISKSSNLLIVLRPGTQAQPITGTLAVPTVSVRFKDGIAEVQQQELIDMMLRHPAFNGDFIAADNVPTDPYAASRRSEEPAHTVTELMFGTPVSRKVVGGDSPLAAMSPEMQGLVKTLAADLAKAMLPSMVAETLKEIVSANEKVKGKVATAFTKTGKPKGKPGRKPKVRVPEAPVAEEFPVA